MATQKEMKPNESIRQIWQYRYPTNLAPKPKEIHVLQCGLQPWGMYPKTTSKNEKDREIRGLDALQIWPLAEGNSCSACSLPP